MKKKLFALLFTALAVVALACGFAACSSSEDRGDPDDLDYMRVGDDYVVTGIGTYKGSDLVIPSKYNGLPVTAVDDAAFYMCRTIKSVTVESGVTSIGSYAFYYCKYLKSAVIPDSVTEIGSYAFRNCTSLENVRIPNAVSKISSYTFYGCTSLRSVTIPEGVTSIGSSAFYGCTALTEINFNAVSMNDLSSSNNVFYNAGKNGSGITVTIGKDVTVIPAYLFYTYSSSSGSPKITALIFEDGCICDSIGTYAFYYCSYLTSVTIPESITSIGSSAFYGCYKLIELYNLSSLTIIAGDSSYGYVGYYARAVYSDKNAESNLYTTSDGYIIFDDGKSQLLIGYIGTETALVLPDDTYYEIYQCAFDGDTAVTSVVIPDFVTSIGSYSFYGCTSLTSLTIGEGVTNISNYAFYGCTALEEIYFNATSLTGFPTDNCVFYNAGRYGSGITVTVGKNVTRIPAYIFYPYSGNSSYTPNLKTVVFEKGSMCTGIGDYAFYYCSSLETVEIPSGVTSIGSYTFSNCSSLTSIVIPDSVMSIGEYAFNYCTSIVDIVIPYGVTSIRDYTFFDCFSLYSVTIPESVTSIGTYAFSYCSSLTSIVIPDSVTTIGNSAFYYCNSLTSLIIPDSVTEIGNYAFGNCTSLENVRISDAVTKISSYTFCDCTSLKSVTIPEGVTSIGYDAFYDCRLLTNITIPSGVTSIGSYAFQNCPKLIEVCNLSSLNITAGSTSNGYVAYYAKNVYTATSGESKFFTTKDGYMFYDDGTMRYLIEYSGTDTALALPDDMGFSYGIYDYAFYNGKKLTSIDIPDSVTSIGSYAFYYCNSLVSLVIPDSVTSIGSYAFGYCSSLTSVSISVSITSISSDTFYNCTSLTSIVIPDSVTSIGSYAFGYCRALTAVTIPEGVTSIGTYAFYNCTALTEINFNAVSLENLSSNSYVFYNAGKNGNGITVTIGADVTGIPAYIFCPYSSNSSYSPKITTLIFEPGSKCTSIGNDAFYLCYNLTKVYYSGSYSDWTSVSVGTNNSPVTSAIMYYYSETEPTADGNFWHYVNGEIVVWKKEGGDL